MAEPRELLRQKIKREYEEETYLPDYLLDSPFLPPGELGDRFSTTRAPANPKFNFREILRWRWRRRIIPLFIITSTVFLLGRTGRSIAVERWYSGPRCLKNPPMIPPSTYLEDNKIDWSKLAYVTYVTNTDYLCNAIMLFETLQRYESRPQRVILHPPSMNPTAISVDGTLLQKALHDFHVKLIPIEVQKKRKLFSSDFWFDSFTKFLAFNQTQYDRVLFLDTDATLQSHLDALFFIPPAVIAVPKAYWIAKPTLGSYMMLIQPSSSEYNRLSAAITAAPERMYDMEIINSIYGDSCSVLPHRNYSLLTGEFRRNTHQGYLKPYPKAKHSKASSLPETDPFYVPELKEVAEVWDPDTYFRAAKYIHFSDSPFTKPWITPGPKIDDFAPACVELPMDKDLSSDSATMNTNTRQDCRARDIWLFLYSDFRKRRLQICGLKPSLY